MTKTTTTIDPIATSDAIVDTYRRYLLSLLPLQDKALLSQLEAAISAAGAISSGPLLEATPPFRSGATLDQLVADGLLSDGFRALFSPALPGDRPLYMHQEQAIRKAKAGRNVVVATGTGSGKTESFLVPILDHLVREKQAGKLGPGVRAMLLYPMNALANDQLKRLRGVLEKYPNITFGRYTGETVHDHRPALDSYRRDFGRDPLPNELISREQMQTNPPHILLTNYAMLEYLLLRPADMELFGGTHGFSWKFVVVDEAHVYDGVKGAEIALLLRRLRQRVTTSQPLQCLASSATVGDDESSVTRFGTALFNVPFEWDPSDPSRQDVVRATRVDISADDAWGRFTAEQYAEIAGTDGSVDVLPLLGGRSLAGEARMRTLQHELEQGPRTLPELGAVVFPELPPADAARSVVDVVAAGHRASRPEGGAVLSARYHLFASAVEGAYACFGRSGPHVRTSRHDRCPDCEAPMFELAACKRCGQLHLPGYVERQAGHDTFRSGSRVNRTRHWLLVGNFNDQLDEDDDVHLDAAVTGNPLAATLCTACGVLGDASATSCKNCPSTDLRQVVRMDAAADLTRCGRCGGRSARQVRRFVTGTDAAAAVLATGLYQRLPDDPKVHTPGRGRRLLMFSDSRQQAAFAAPYLQQTYGELYQRRLVAQGLAKQRTDELTTDDMVSVVRAEAERAQVFMSDELRSLKAREQIATWLHRELIEGDERQSLEGTGIARVTLRRGPGAPPAPLLRLGLTADQAWDLMEQLVQTVRVQGAVAPALDTVDLTDPMLEPRNRATYIQRDASNSKLSVLSWLPSRPGLSNRRLNYLDRVLAAAGSAADPREVLGGVWDFLQADQGTRWFLPHTDRQRGPVWRVDPKALLWNTADGHPLWVCDQCRQPAARNVLGVCSTNNCTGTLRQLADTERGNDGHYQTMYRTLEVCGMSAEEHTAQLTRSVGAEVQEKFLTGDVNVLSCSTTFELGVDVGELQSVLLRNVPPTTANYVQRAGRAGRRTDSAALVVTYAQLRSHDQAMFAVPQQMIKGTVRAPVVVVDNARVDRRHAHSVVLSAFFLDQLERLGRQYHTAADLFGESPTRTAGLVELKAYLADLPDGVVKAVREVLPAGVATEIGLHDGSWLTRLRELLDDVAAEFGRDIDFFEEQRDEAAKGRSYKQADMFERVLRTLNSQQLLSLLARRNVLPKYGFPVDTVELRVAPNAFANADKLELSRDLMVAINEYAPGGEIVARGNVITSAGLYRLPKRELVTWHYAICQNPQCEHLEVDVDNNKMGDVCPMCQTPRTGSPTQYVKPEFGFVASRTIRKVGTTRPESRWLSRMHLLNEGEQDAAGSTNTAVGKVDWKLGIRASLLYLNEGPQGRRYGICKWCGASEAAATAPRKPPKTHQNPMTGKDCAGWRDNRALGHDVQTDALFLTIPQLATREQARSVLYGLLAGAAEALEISRDDIDGTIMPAADPTLVLFDAVPGGAGLVRRIAENLTAVVNAMRSKVSRCECGPETSCHRCLRVYRNQLFHEDLKRQHVLDLFGESPEPLWDETLGLTLVGAWRVAYDAAADDTERQLVLDLAALDGVPAPTVGAEGPFGIPLGIAWPGRQVFAESPQMSDADRRDLIDADWTLVEADVQAIRALLLDTAAADDIDLGQHWCGTPDLIERMRITDLDGRIVGSRLP